MRQITSPRAYFLSNIILSGVILLIMGYSLFFSPDKDNYPVVCIHETITGQQCPSCGMSHAFSLIIRGRFSEASEWNPYAFRLFLFFIIQFIMRIGISVWLRVSSVKYSLVAYADVSVTVVMAAMLLYPLLLAQWSLITVCLI